MKAKLIEGLSWSKWFDDSCGFGKFTYLHTWREATHPEYHKVEIWRNSNGTYDCLVFGGAYGETEILRETYNNAYEARTQTEKAVKYALKEGLLKI